MLITAIIQEALRMAGDPGPLRASDPVGGGSISRALRLRTDRATYLLKAGGSGLDGFFAAEADGLARIGATGALRTPAVLALRDDPAGGFILLEWLQPPAGAPDPKAGEQLGQGLAALHRATAERYGLERDNYIGATPQPNGWMDSWVEFFRERRLRPQIELARRHGRLHPERTARLAQLLEQLDRWIDDGVVRPSLLHGDLWSGNVIAGPDGAPALIDPAVYYGDREADLALTALFGGFAPSFYRAYSEAWPLEPGWQERRDIYNLYHALNHLNLFGESYGSLVDSTLRRYTNG